MGVYRFTCAVTIPAAETFGRPGYARAAPLPRAEQLLARGCSPVSLNLSKIIDSPRNNGVRRTLRSIEAADIV